LDTLLSLESEDEHAHECANESNQEVAELLVKQADVLLGKLFEPVLLNDVESFGQFREELNRANELLIGELLHD